MHEVNVIQSHSKGPERLCGIGRFDDAPLSRTCTTLRISMSDLSLVDQDGRRAVVRFRIDTRETAQEVLLGLVLRRVAYQLLFSAAVQGRDVPRVDVRDAKAVAAAVPVTISTATRTTASW